MNDHFAQAQIQDVRVAVGVCVTTDLCRAPQQSHGLMPTSSIALGRLMTAAVLTSQLGQRPEALSLQIVSDGRLGQLFADVTLDGRVRGYVKNHRMDMPALPDEDPRGRRSVAPAVGQGALSAIRFANTNDYVQSTTPLVSGEVDEDVAAYLNESDQVPTSLWCDVLLDGHGSVIAAGGLLIQAMPDTRRSKFDALRARVAEPAFWRALSGCGGDVHALLTAALPEARLVGAPMPLRWECRCTYERVVSALKMLGAQDLADMVDRKETPEVICDFCGKKYVVDCADVEQAFLDTVTGRG